MNIKPSLTSCWKQQTGVSDERFLVTTGSTTSTSLIINLTREEEPLSGFKLQQIKTLLEVINGAVFTTLGRLKTKLQFTLGMR